MKEFRVGAHSHPLEEGWWSPPARRLHLALAIGLPGCLAAGWFEFSRAIAGHEIAWVYAGEWPLYGVLGTYMWWKLLHSETVDVTKTDSAGLSPSLPDEVDQLLPSGSDGVSPSEPGGPIIDPGLAEWQSYLARLHSVDPPGQPPART